VDAWKNPNEEFPIVDAELVHHLLQMSVAERARKMVDASNVISVFGRPLRDIYEFTVASSVGQLRRELRAREELSHSCQWNVA
jgi:hypothetical protein